MNIINGLVRCGGCGDMLPTDRQPGQTAWVPCYQCGRTVTARVQPLIRAARSADAHIPQTAASFPHAAGAGQVQAGSVPARAPGSSPLPGGSLPDIQIPIKGRAVEGGDVEGDASLSAAGLPGQSGEVVDDGAHSQDVSDVTTGSDARHAEVRVGAAPTLTAFKIGWDDDGADWDPPAVFTPDQEDAIRARFERQRP